jgi:hypothetical protein
VFCQVSVLFVEVYWQLTDSNEMIVNQQENTVDACAYNLRDGGTSVDITSLLRGTKRERFFVRS